MAIRMLKFPSIEQFRNIVHNVTSRAQWVGKDENGDSIYDTSKPLPKLTFQGAIKLHGTNAGVGADTEGNVWCQSRENIITPQHDNAGFAMFVHANSGVFDLIINQAREIKPITDDQAMLIFGEWCGSGIQKGIGLTQLPKQFVIFGIARIDNEGEREWFTANEVSLAVGRVRVLNPENFKATNIHHIYDFPSWHCTIDFARPQDIQQKLVDLTIQVETECPVAKQLGAVPENGPMIGEGIVWKCTDEGYESSGYWFKVKGEKHSATKTKVLKPVDADRVDAINDLAERVTPEWRLEQMMQETFDTINGGRLDIKRMGDYIKAVMNDVMKEDLDLIADSGFTTKEVTSPISKIARDYLLKQMQF